MTRSVQELADAGVAFVAATVVRCAPPTSARPGDRAIVLSDGTMEGFVGGSCADETVRAQALRALETGEPTLLRILPGVLPADQAGGGSGEVVVANPCLSGGSLELFLEPSLPRPRVAVTGDSPAARSLIELAAALGFDARLAERAVAGDFGAVVASLGHGDEGAVRAALDAGCAYVGLVASRTRGAAVLDALRADGVAEWLVARVRTPAGLSLGARTHPEIALSILAELVQARRAAPLSVATIVDPAVPQSPETGMDPICQMAVAITADAITADGHVFCCEGCRDTWLARG